VLDAVLDCSIRGRVSFVAAQKSDSVPAVLLGPIVYAKAQAYGDSFEFQTLSALRFVMLWKVSLTVICIAQELRECEVGSEKEVEGLFSMSDPSVVFGI